MDLKNETITIQEISQQQWGRKIKDSRGLIFNVPATKKDGTPTKVAGEQLDIGQTISVNYAEVPNKHGGTSRWVRFFGQSNQNAGQVGQNIEQRLANLEKQVDAIAKQLEPAMTGQENTVPQPANPVPEGTIPPLQAQEEGEINVDEIPF